MKIVLIDGKLLVAVLAMFLYSTKVLAQNVGIGTNSPTEKLDVNGNLNLAGNLLTNGNAGVAGQVLGTNALGNTVWTNLAEYTNHLSFIATGASNWTVPAGVTKISVEAWGGGGGGSGTAGGGGGGYISAYFTVTPGASVSFTIGAGGIGVANGMQPANNGSFSSVTVNGITVYGYAGLGSYGYSANGTWLGRGGSFGVSNSLFANWLGIGGDDGTPNQVSYDQPNGSTYYETTLCGKGGDAGNSLNTGAGGGFVLFNLTLATQVKYVAVGKSGQPGGGGCGNRDNASYFGSNGESGMVRLHY